MNNYQDRTFVSTEWLSLKYKQLEDGRRYFYSHETRCNGLIVAILPYRATQYGFEVLLRYENTPCWREGPHICSITGGIEAGDTAQETVIKELKEETGYDLTGLEHRIYALNSIKGTKSSDTDYYLFAVNLTNLEPGEANPEPGEESETQRWHKYIPYETADPLVYAIYHRQALFKLGGIK